MSAPLFPDLPERIAVAAAPFLESVQPGDSVEFMMRVSTAAVAQPRFVLGSLQRTDANEELPFREDEAERQKLETRSALEALDFSGLCRELLRRGWPRSQRFVMRLPGGELSLMQSKSVLK